MATTASEALVPTPSKSLGTALSTTEAHGLATQHLPTFFKGQEKYAAPIVHAYRNFTQNFQTNTLNIAIQQHVEAIIPISTALKKYIQADHKMPFAKPKFVQNFLDEIDRREAQKNVDPIWLLGIYLRYAAAVSDFSDDERDLIMHLVDHETFESILQNEPWDSHIYTSTSVLANENYTPVVHWSYYQNLHHSMSDLLTAELQKYFPSPVYYPFAGSAKFGISFMITCYLNQVFPLGLPLRNKKDNKLPAHGTRLSPLPFISHDILHGDIDSRIKAIKELILGKASAFVERGGYAPDFIKFYTPIAVRQYQALMSCLNHIHNAFLGQLLPYFGKAEFKKTIIGFFLMTHEYPEYDANIYTDNDLETAVHQLTSNSKNVLLSSTAWESAADPLKTSPLDGSSALSEAEILKYVFQNNLIPDLRNGSISTPNNFYTTYPQPPIEESLARLVHKASAILSPSGRFMDVTFQLKTGQTQSYSYPTLFLKWSNVNDSLALLKMADVNVQKPDISGLNIKESRTIVKQHLKVVRHELIKLLDHFESRAAFFANKKDVDGSSLGDRYFQWQFKLQNKVDIATTRVLSNVPLSKRK